MLRARAEPMQPGYTVSHRGIQVSNNGRKQVNGHMSPMTPVFRSTELGVAGPFQQPTWTACQPQAAVRRIGDHDVLTREELAASLGLDACTRPRSVSPRPHRLSTLPRSLSPSAFSRSSSPLPGSFAVPGQVSPRQLVAPAWIRATAYQSTPQTPLAHHNHQASQVSARQLVAPARIEQELSLPTAPPVAPAWIEQEWSLPAPAPPVWAQRGQMPVQLSAVIQPPSPCLPPLPADRIRTSSRCIGLERPDAMSGSISTQPPLSCDGQLPTMAQLFNSSEPVACVQPVSACGVNEVPSPSSGAMTCANCNDVFIHPNARFCRRCGEPRAMTSPETIW